jgi:hypothetical protein
VQNRLFTDGLQELKMAKTKRIKPQFFMPEFLRLDEP